MDFLDETGTRYQLTEASEAPAPAKKPVWPWVVGGLALAGGLAWMASSRSRRPNPMSPEVEALVTEARDPNTPRDRLWELFDQPQQSNELRRALLDNPNICPVEEDGSLNTILLGRLAEIIPNDVAQHPVFVLHAIVEPKDEMCVVAATVAAISTDGDTISHLVNNYGVETGFLRDVVRNPHVPIRILREFAKDKRASHWEVRKNIANNSKTPADVLKILGDPRIEPEKSVRSSVATNPNTAADLLSILGSPLTEPEAEVRFRVVTNPGVTREILVEMSDATKEKQEYVRSFAERKLVNL